MVCYACKTYFCYLCGAYFPSLSPCLSFLELSNLSFLDPSAPYVHFWAGGTGQRTSCEGMLFAGIEDNGEWNEDQRRMMEGRDGMDEDEEEMLF